jgi:hypothetical protein
MGEEKTSPLSLFGLAVLCVLATTRAILVEFQPIRVIATIFLGGVIAFFAITAL